MYPDSLNMYVYTDQEEHSDVSSEEAQRLWSSCAVAEANNFPFLEPIEDGKYYEFVLIRTDTTRGPKSVKGNENHIFALVLIFFRLDYDEKPQRIPVV